MTKFENELKLIQNPFCKAFAQYCVDHIDPRFFEEAASTTGKYHPQYALGLGGLYRHTCAAVQIAESLMQLDCIKQDCSLFDKPDSYVHDAVILALIMHDSCKCGKYFESKYTLHDHPVVAFQFVQDLALQMISEGEIETPEFIKEFAFNVSNLIITHMGQWTTARWSNEILPAPSTNLQKFVHVCDYLASRKFLLWDYDNNVYGVDALRPQSETNEY